MSTIEVKIGIKVTEDSGSSGPKIDYTNQIKVESYEKIEVDVEPGEELTLEVQPSPGKQVSFLLIKSSLYSDDIFKITYGVNKPDQIELEREHLYVGSEVVSALGDTPNQLIFKNNYPAGDKNTTKLEILVGRDVVKPTDSAAVTAGKTS
jgi:hypothetical protein